MGEPMIDHRCPTCGSDDPAVREVDDILRPCANEWHDDDLPARLDKMADLSASLAYAAIHRTAAARIRELEAEVDRLKREVDRVEDPDAIDYVVLSDQLKAEVARLTALGNDLADVCKECIPAGTHGRPRPIDGQLIEELDAAIYAWEAENDDRYSQLLRFTVAERQAAAARIRELEAEVARLTALGTDLADMLRDLGRGQPVTHDQRAAAIDAWRNR
jgi:hypothetical protein